MIRTVAFATVTWSIGFTLLGAWHCSWADQPEPSEWNLGTVKDGGTKRTKAPALGSGAQRSIRRALRGDARPTGDGVLDDVLNVIKRRGSILEGSSLDPDASAESDAAAWGTSTSIRARAAEQLLRAARLLDMAEPVTERRADLCRQMRAEAAKLLSE